MKQFAKVLASFSLAATMCLGVGFAADSPHPGEHGTVDKAMVSEETDNHLHFEVLLAGARIDPLTVVEPQ